MLLVAAAVAGCRKTEAAQEQSGAQARPADVEDVIRRGEYLVSIAACNDCHTPWVMGPEGPAPDLSRMLSGHPQNVVLPPAPMAGDSAWVWFGAATNTAYAGPWGTSYAINLTPDQETGLGNWTEEMFVNAIRTGKHAGVGRPIMPPMPWPAYRNMTDEDLRSVFAYLGSIPPVKNQPPEYQPPRPAN